MGLEDSHKLITPPATPPRPHEEEVKKEEVLLKQSRGTLGLSRRFKKRCLSLTDRALRWTSERGTPRGGSALRHINGIRLGERRDSTGSAPDLGSSSSANRYCFEILTCDGVTRVWAADSAESALSWVEAIRQAIRDAPQWPPEGGISTVPPGTALGSAASTASTSSSMSRSLSRSPSHSPPQSGTISSAQRKTLGKGRPPKVPSRLYGRRSSQNNALDDDSLASGNGPTNSSSAANNNNSNNNRSFGLSVKGLGARCSSANSSASGWESAAGGSLTPLVVAIVVAGPHVSTNVSREQHVVARGPNARSAVHLPRLGLSDGIILRMSDGSEAEIPARLLPKPGQSGVVNVAAVGTAPLLPSGGSATSGEPAVTLRLEAKFAWAADGKGAVRSASRPGRLARVGQCVCALRSAFGAGGTAYWCAKLAVSAFEARRGGLCWDERGEEAADWPLFALQAVLGSLVVCIIVASVRRSYRRDAKRASDAAAAAIRSSGRWTLTVSPLAESDPRNSSEGVEVASGRSRGDPTAVSGGGSAGLVVDSEVSAAVVPRRFLEGCPGDPEEARRRYEATLAWRAAERVDFILTEPQPHFDLIKEHYPHFFCGKAKSGNHVYYERPGQVNMAALQAAGISLDIMLRYYLFLTEWCWQVMDPRDDVGKLISVFDANGLSVRDAWGEGLEFTKRASAVHGAHYIERCQVLLVINVPMWFSAVWKVLKPMVNERTLAKIKILRGSEVLTEMRKHVDDNQIPVEYGGSLSFPGFGPHAETCRYYSDEERALRAFVTKVNGAAAAAGGARP